MLVDHADPVVGIRRLSQGLSTTLAIELQIDHDLFSNIVGIRLAIHVHRFQMNVRLDEL